MTRDLFLSVMPLWDGPVFSLFMSHLPLCLWNYLTYMNLIHRSMMHLYGPPLLLNWHPYMDPYWLPTRHIRIHPTFPLLASIFHIRLMQFLPILSRFTLGEISYEDCPLVTTCSSSTPLTASHSSFGSSAKISKQGDWDFSLDEASRFSLWCPSGSSD